MNDRYEAIDNPDFKISIKPAGYYLARVKYYFCFHWLKHTLKLTYSNNLIQ